MFCLSRIEHTLGLPPHLLSLPIAEAIHKELEKLYLDKVFCYHHFLSFILELCFYLLSLSHAWYWASSTVKVIANLGLCICVYDIRSIEGGYIFPGDGAATYTVCVLNFSCCAFKCYNQKLFSLCFPCMSTKWCFLKLFL